MADLCLHVKEKGLSPAIDVSLIYVGIVAVLIPPGLQRFLLPYMERW